MNSLASGVYIRSDNCQHNLTNRISNEKHLKSGDCMLNPTG